MIVKQVRRSGTGPYCGGGAPPFLPGLDLCRIFYLEAVRPLLEQAYPGLPHAAARLGPGSEVLGFDTERSVDHDWGRGWNCSCGPRMPAGTASGSRSC